MSAALIALLTGLGTLVLTLGGAALLIVVAVLVQPADPTLPELEAMTDADKETMPL